MPTSEAQVEAALRRNFGNVTMAAAELGITRQAVHMRIAGSERLQAARIDIDEVMVDVAEGTMFQGILEKDLPTTRWFLTQKGRARGYGERREMVGPNGGPMQMQVQPVAPVLPLDAMPDDEREMMRELLRRQQQRMLTGSADD